MKLFKAFFQLIRWPNLVFIVLTQCLFYYCIILPYLPESYYSLSNRITDFNFALIVLSSVFIAAGGYIINDYFDINIDQINKPSKLIVEKIIKRRWAIVLHLIITTVGVVLSFLAALQTSLIIFAVNVLCTVLLWLYSTTFKKKLLSGNIIISVLTAWTIFILYFASNANFSLSLDADKNIVASMQYIFKFSILYAGFAFIISLIREVVKDMEDMEGDARYGCKTMPIVWGIPVSKVFVAIWLIVLICVLCIVQVYTIQLGWWISVIYCLLLVILPLLFVLKKLYQAKVALDYHRLSTVIKIIMLTGILSMLFFKYYAA